MNKDIYKDYILKNIFIEKGNIKTIVIIVLVLLILNVLFSFALTINNFAEYSIKKNIDYRTFFVIRDDLISESDAIKELKTINHVIEVFPDSYYYTVLDVTGNTFTGDFIIYGATKNTAPNVSKGNFFEDKFEIICPEKFFPKSDLSEEKNLTKESFIDMNKYINKTITISYNKYTDVENSIFEEKNINLKVVGTYKNSNTLIDENICYANHNLVGNINNDIYENIDMSSQINSIMVQIDSIEHINDVVDEIISLGYSPSQALSFNPTFLNIIKIASYVLTFLGIVFIISIFVFNNKRNFNDYANEVKLLSFLGFNQNQIKKIISLKKYTLCGISLCIFFIIVLIIYIFYNILINYKPLLFTKLPISINFPILGLSITVIIFCVHLSNKLLLSKIKGQLNNDN